MGKENKLPYVRFYASDWLAGTRGMTAAETGVYITLIAMMYEACEPLTSDFSRLARKCGCPAGPFKRIVSNLIAEGKITNDKGLWNDRVEKEIHWRKSLSMKRSLAGSYKAKNHSQNNGEKEQLQNNCTSNARKPEARSQLATNVAKRGFDQFWTAYPRKVAKGTAKQAYAKAVKRAPPESILDGAKRYAASVRGKDVEFIAHPATWLNAERWLDEEPKRSTVTSGPWKPFKSETKDPERLPPGERAAQVDRLLKRAASGNTA